MTLKSYPNVSLFLNSNESKVFKPSNQLPREIEIMGGRSKVETPIAKKSLVQSKATSGRSNSATDSWTDSSLEEPSPDSQLAPSNSKLAVSPSRQPPTSAPLPEVSRTVHQYPSISLFLNANESKVFRTSKQLLREFEEDTEVSPRPACSDATPRPIRHCDTAISALRQPPKIVGSFPVSKRLSQILEDSFQEPNGEADLTDGGETKALKRMSTRLHHYPSVSNLLHATERQIFTRSAKIPRETSAAVGRQEHAIDGGDESLATKKTDVEQTRRTPKADVVRNGNTHTTCSSIGRFDTA